MLQNYLLYAVVFIGGAVVMILEIVGSRILAPFLGNSIFVWSSLIGIILGSLSIGYFWGGKLADKKPEYTKLGLILAGAAILILITATLNLFVLSIIQVLIADVRIGSIIATILLFTPATIFLGMITPYAVRLSLVEIEHSGETVGKLYAVSTVGSIVGTFLAGFVLLSYIGSNNILILLAVVLFGTTSFVFARGNKKIPFTLLFSLFVLSIAAIGMGFVSQTVFVADMDTSYNRVIIFDRTEKESNRPVRYLMTEAKALQSAVYLDGDDLVSDYTKFYRLAAYFNPNLSRALMLGGGGFAYPRDFFKQNPDAKLDIVEIDPKLIEISRQYMNLTELPHMRVIHEDGRIFLNKNKSVYDVILVDAFSSYFSIPFQLTTKEAIEKMSDSLAQNGVLLVNIIGTIEGKSGSFFRAEYRTYKEIFPHLFVFLVSKPDDGTALQNIMLAAFKEEPMIDFTNEEMRSFWSHLWTKEIPEDKPVLTDSFAPVEQYTMKLL